jgi:hypothetical protein
MVERSRRTWHPFYNGLSPRGLCHLADDAFDRVGVDAVCCGAGPFGSLDQRSRQLMTFRQFDSARSAPPARALPVAKVRATVGRTWRRSNSIPTGKSGQSGLAGCTCFGSAGEGSTVSFGSVGKIRAPAARTRKRMFRVTVEVNVTTLVLDACAAL